MKQKDARSRKGLQDVIDYQVVFNSPQGVAVLHDLMEKHCVLQPTYSGDVNETLVREGERRVVLRILALIKTNPKQLLERIVEHEKQME